MTTTTAESSQSTELSPTYRPADVESRITERWNAARAWHAQPHGAATSVAMSDHEGGAARRPLNAPYAILIPPPNVTAALHMGHALNNTLQDILIRWRRMAGDNAMWMPGTDHAGIATQTVVEKRVLQEEGKRRIDFERDAFVEKIQAWKDQYEQRITDQLKAMGCSCDWDRQRFTMDPVCAAAVREAFFELFKDGLIYRGKRLVNWDPATQTALADDEVEMEEVDGYFWYLKYPLEPFSGRRAAAPLELEGDAARHPLNEDFVTVATTRPETMLGDTAVAVNPRDPDRAHLIGRKVKLPIVGRVIPIIGDEHVVIPPSRHAAPEERGTSDEGAGKQAGKSRSRREGLGEGAPEEKLDPIAQYASGFLKVTPAHDPNDYEIGKRHDLPIINIMAPDASISDQHGWTDVSEEARPLVGLAREEARDAIVQWFKDHDLLEDVKSYRHAVGHSYRSHVAIEPYLSDQWYIAVNQATDRLGGKSLAQAALDALANYEEGGETGGAGVSPASPKLQFTPARYAKTFHDWHENIRDWCISRQLWWGHRIPVWRKDGSHTFSAGPKGRVAVVKQDDATYVCPREDDPQIIAQLERAGFTRDPDVLDTWFSSALWPMSTLGWPNPEKFPQEFPHGDAALQTWNPSNVLCTAREIITLWVSRMVMFNLYFRGNLPFTDVFIHSMIQDGQGRKMSKSLGNGVDPLDIIASHGSDAMRYTLASMTTHTQDVRMPVTRDPDTGRNTSDKFDLGRNFANKLWNAVRFALTNLTVGVSASADMSSHEGDAARHPLNELDLADRWILSRLARAVESANNALSEFRFADYAQTLYDFFWRDLCDWYIEAVKPTISQSATQRACLAACIDVSLRLLHPMMPFITERLWEALNKTTGTGTSVPVSDVPVSSAPLSGRGIPGIEIPPAQLLMTAAWPRVERPLIDRDAEETFELCRQIVGAVRQVRTQHQIPPRQTVEVSSQMPASTAQTVLAHRALIETLANFRGREIGPDVSRPGDAAVAIVGPGIEIYIHGLVDADTERARLQKRLDALEKQIKTLRGRLSNESYVAKAPAKLVKESRSQLADAEREAEAVRKQQAVLE